ncbi:DsbA family protein [Methylobacterium hispanicum]|nr:DsbA family protein [Methylobacterium hispanicum]
MTRSRRARTGLSASTVASLALGAGLVLVGPFLPSSAALGGAVPALAAGESFETLVRREVERQIPAVVREIVEKASPIAIEKWVRENPDKVAEALSAMIQKNQKAQADEADARVHALDESLFHAEIVPVLGNPAGRVEIVYFFDVNCGFCKMMEPRLAKLAAENPDVKIVHREVGILGAGSDYAAHFNAGIWTLARDKYPGIHAKLMARKQPLRTKEEVEAFMTQELGAAATARIREAVLREGDPLYGIVTTNSNLAVGAGVQGTPFVYVRDGGMFRGAVDDKALSDAVAKARAAR